MSNISLILWVSVALQCIAVVLALRLIPVTGRALAWIILSAAFFLMASRRTISLLYEEGFIQTSLARAISTEIVALIISCMIVTGVFMIRRIFVQQHANAEAIRKLSLAVEQNPSSTIIMDTSGTIEYVNSSFSKVTGYQPDEVIGDKPDILKSSCTKQLLLRDLWNTLNKGQVWKGEFCNKCKNGDVRWEKACISPVKDHAGEITHYVAVLEDITVQKEQRKALEFIALHDTLTNLPNRTLFEDRLSNAIARAKHDNSRFAVMMLDIDNFKEINDALGHYVGDVILREIGKRLSSAVSESDTVARMGGDQFLMLMPYIDDNHSDTVINDLIKTAQAPYQVSGRNFDLRVSLGLTCFPDDAQNADMILKNADVALYAAKASTDNFARYKPELDEGNISRLELIGDIRNAIQDNQFRLYYQPQFKLDSSEIVNVEALIRWIHPARGFLSPDEFIPFAEQSGHISLITEWVIKTATKQLADWHKQGWQIGVSINIAATDLQNTDLINYFEQQISSYNINPTKLTVEITESSLMLYTQQTMQSLYKLSDLGLHIAIDDFGTGYSSLQHLKELPVNELKIDKSFIKNMIRNDNDAVIVRSITDLAHNLGLHVVAEGIEDQETCDILDILHCEYGQGYHMAKPLIAEELELWFSQQEARHPQTSLDFMSSSTPA